MVVILSHSSDESTKGWKYIRFTVWLFRDLNYMYVTQWYDFLNMIRYVEEVYSFFILSLEPIMEERDQCFN